MGGEGAPCVILRGEGGRGRLGMDFPRRHQCLFPLPILHHPGNTDTIGLEANSMPSP